MNVINLNKELSVDYDFHRLLAKKARENQGYEAGVVLIFGGKVYGWKNELRNPEHEMPGAIAVDENGRIWVARGGNVSDGAEFWDEEDIQICFDFDEF